MNKQKNADKLANMTYVELISLSNKMLNGSGIKAYTVSNGLRARKWRFIKIPF